MDNSMLTFFVGVIAICMVAITVVTLIIGGQLLRTVRELTDLVAQTKAQMKDFSARTTAAVTNIEALSSVVNLITLFFKRRN